MARTCSVCADPRRSAVDRAIIQGKSNRAVSQLFSPLSPDAIGRHRQNHLAEALAAAKTAREQALREAVTVRAATEADRSLDLGRELGRLYRLSMADVVAGHKVLDDKLKYKGMDRAIRLLELQARIDGLVRDGTQVNVLMQPEYLELRAVLLKAAEAHPEAKTAMLEGLEQLEEAQAIEEAKSE